MIPFSFDAVKKLVSYTKLYPTFGECLVYKTTQFITKSSFSSQNRPSRSSFHTYFVPELHSICFTWLGFRFSITCRLRLVAGWMLWHKSMISAWSRLTRHLFQSVLVLLMIVGYTGYQSFLHAGFIFVSLFCLCLADSIRVCD